MDRITLTMISQQNQNNPKVIENLMPVSETILQSKLSDKELKSIMP